MDLTFSKALDGKFFINVLQASHGLPSLVRGKILGPIATEMSPYYLCDLFPTTDTEIAIDVQTLFSLDQLAGVYLYVDRVTQDAAWDEMQRQRRHFEAQQKKAAETRGPRNMRIQQLPDELIDALGLESAAEVKQADTTAEEPPTPKLRRLRKPRTEDPPQ